MEETIKKLCEFIEKVGTKNLDATDIDYLYKVADIYKDLKEVENMNDYGRESYGRYSEYGRGYGANESVGKRGVDSRYKASKYMESMRGGYEAYEDSRNEYSVGNYGAKEDGLKELEYMMHAAVKFIKMVKEEATSPEEQEIVKKYIMKLSEM